VFHYGFHNGARDAIKQKAKVAHENFCGEAGTGREAVTEIEPHISAKN